MGIRYIVQWNSVNKSTVNKSSRLLHPICLERNRLVHFRKRRLFKPPRIKSKTGYPEVDLLTEFHCILVCLKVDFLAVESAD